jgi:hypothetical protein
MTRATTYRQPWLHSAIFDMVFIVLPGFMALAVTFLLPDVYKTTDTTSLAGWVVLILLIDVAHVYSTLFRTYMDRERLAKNRVLYTIVPVACYATSVLLYALGPLVFWRVLAYLAVYHFVRQQYGFMRLYARQDSRPDAYMRIDSVAIYAATLYPLVYWHCTPGRNFNWFVAGDFIIQDLALVRQLAGYGYIGIIGTYLLKELVSYRQFRTFNLPKNLIIAGTCMSWYFGIVYFNGDMVFTLLNVVAHGVPYMALIWMYRQKEAGYPVTSIVSRRLPQFTLLFFLLTIVAFAYLEEGLWDGLVWKEHSQIFGIFQALPMVHSKELLALLVPLLSLPQTTHYVLDGYIWKKPRK